MPALNDADHEILLSAVRFGLKKDIALRFEVLSGEWKVLGGKGYALFDRQEQKEQLPLADELTFGVISGADHVTLIVTGEAESLPCFQKIDISRLRELTVGKQEG